MDTVSYQFTTVRLPGVQELCTTVVDFLDGALACGVIDLNTGMSMALRHTNTYFVQLYLDAAVAALDLVHGARVRGEAYDEFFVVTDTGFQFMKRIPDVGALAILLTLKSTSQDLSWASLRAAVAELGQARPRSILG